MTDPEELERALELQQKGYQLILWLGSLTDRSIVAFDQAHEAASMAEAGRHWLERNLSTLPERCRPEPGDLEAFANIVASFLSSSFDLVAEPGTRRDSRCGCYCSWCSCAVAASHLKTKKVSGKDKKRSLDLQADLLMSCALELNRSLAREEAVRMLEDKDVGEAAAVVAYADELIRRMKGLYEGPAVLALWRRFAWNEKGSPKKDFRLKVEDVRRAEARIERVIRKIQK